MAHLTQRTLTPEIMDQEDVPEDQLRKSLSFIRWVNRYAGGTRAVTSLLARWADDWPEGRAIRILDVATGSADIPLAIARWARKHDRQVKIVAVDRHPKTLALAAEHIRGEAGIDLVQADALQLPFAANEFDYCVSSMFLHHLGDIEVLTVLKAMDNLAARGMIWNDLNRNALAYWATRAVTLVGDRIVRHDGPVSVLAGFRRSEVLDFRDRLELDYLQYRSHLCYRFTLAGEK